MNAPNNFYIYFIHIFLTPPQIGLKLSGTKYWTLLKKDNRKEVSIINPNCDEEAEFFSDEAPNLP